MRRFLLSVVSICAPTCTSSPGNLTLMTLIVSFMQPAPQSYGSPSFQMTHGKTASFFMPEGQGVQQEFAFTPDDGSATHVVHMERTSTKVLTGQYLLFSPSYLVCLLLRSPLPLLASPSSSVAAVLCSPANTFFPPLGPPQKDPFASYTASPTALIMLASNGQIAYLGYDPKSDGSGEYFFLLPSPVLVPVSLSFSRLECGARFEALP